jgi:phosphatidylglycerol:prolipoprotein diacylglycerol transferase
MFPVLFSFGPLTFYTFNIFLLLGVVGGAFLFWQRTHAEHFEDDEVFDVILVGGILSVIAARIGYTLFHITVIPSSVQQVVELVTKSGFDEISGMVVGLFYVFVAAKRRKWDAFELADFGAISLSFLFIILWVGRFFAGSYPGDVTSLPIGVNFPNVFDTRHPSQLYFALIFFIVYIMLLALEKQYRFFGWYRGSKQTANSGFLLSLFLIFYGAVHFALSFVQVQQLVILNLRLDLFFYILIFLYGIGLMYWRSGHNPFTKKRWGKNQTTQTNTGGSRLKLWSKKNQ